MAARSGARGRRLQPETLTEDADLTLTILQRGGRVVYEPEAYGKTEAPESLGALMRQRFRWTYGTYQCMWKHRGAFFRGTLGWVGLPNMVIFQLLFPLISPIGDIVMVLSVFRGDWRAFLAGYVAFLAMDIGGSLLAFTAGPQAAALARDARDPALFVSPDHVLRVLQGDDRGRARCALRLAQASTAPARSPPTTATWPRPKSRRVAPRRFTTEPVHDWRVFGEGESMGRDPG